MRERWLRTQAEEGARLGHVLAGLAEQRAAVVVTILGGRQVAGRLTGVGADYVSLVADAGRITLVALAGLAWVRPSAGPSRRRLDPATGPEPAPGFDLDLDATGAAPPRPEGSPDGALLVDVLAQAVANRPRVTITADAATVSGTLRAVGIDLIVVETAGDPPVLAYVRLRSLYEISFLDSG